MQTLYTTHVCYRVWAKAVLLVSISAKSPKYNLRLLQIRYDRICTCHTHQIKIPTIGDIFALNGETAVKPETTVQGGVFTFVSVEQKDFLCKIG